MRVGKLPKLDVAGSNPVSRSRRHKPSWENTLGHAECSEGLGFVVLDRSLTQPLDVRRRNSSSGNA